MYRTNDNNLVDTRGEAAPRDAGDCQACGGEMYEYEVTSCDSCDNDRIHAGCIVICSGCGEFGCKCCMKKDDETGEWFCKE